MRELLNNPALILWFLGILWFTWMSSWLWHKFDERPAIQWAILAVMWGFIAAVFLTGCESVTSASPLPTLSIPSSHLGCEEIPNGRMCLFAEGQWEFQGKNYDGADYTAYYFDGTEEPTLHLNVPGLPVISGKRRICVGLEDGKEVIELDGVGIFTLTPIEPTRSLWRQVGNNTECYDAEVSLKGGILRWRR